MSYINETQKTEILEKEKLLVIANASTHHDRPRGIQVNRLLSELSDYYNVYLITSKQSVPDDPEKYFDSQIRKIIIINGTNKLIKKLSKHIWSFLNHVDIFFAKRAFVVAKELIEVEKIQKVLCTSFRNAIAGRYLKNYFKNNIKIISFFSDPVADNPYLPSSGLTKKIVQRIESGIFRSSDINILPSFTMTEFYRKKYYDQKEKFIYIPHSFLPMKDSMIEEKKRNDKFTIRHIGGLNEIRNPFSLIDYINRNNPDYLKSKNVFFEFYGRYSKKVQIKIKNFKSDNIKFYGEVPYSKTNALHQTADALFVIDADITPSYFLPSKLIEILPYRKPVLILTTKGSESSRIGNLLGLNVFYHDNIQSIISILDIIRYHNGNSKDISGFSITSIAKQYKNCIETV